MDAVCYLLGRNPQSIQRHSERLPWAQPLQFSGSWNNSPWPLLFYLQPHHPRTTSAISVSINVSICTSFRPSLCCRDLLGDNCTDIGLTFHMILNQTACQNLLGSDEICRAFMVAQSVIKRSWWAVSYRGSVCSGGHGPGLTGAVRGNDWAPPHGKHHSQLLPPPRCPHWHSVPHWGCQFSQI